MTSQTRIIVIDDDGVFCEHLRFVFAEAGYDVRSVSSAHEGIQAARDYQPDLAVIDWMLKADASGLDVARALRQANPRIAILIITGYLDLPASERANFDGILEKPFHAQELLHTVSRILSHYE